VPDVSLRTAPWPPGVPCWAEVDVGDLDRCTAFYSAVLGWSFTDHGAVDHHQAVARHAGRPAAGLGSTGAAAPPAWTLYFATADADAACVRVEELGGTLLYGPEDVGRAGRLFVAVDLGGAVFGGWEYDQHIGAGIVNEPGALVWADSASADPAQSRSFYRSLFGFRYESIPEAGPEYTTFYGQDPFPLGGIGSAGDELPHWLVYFGVTDAHASVDAALGAGGGVARAVRDSPYGRSAVLLDPAGARFAVIETDPATQPDRSGP